MQMNQETAQAAGSAQGVDRQAILEAAQLLFADLGFTGTTMKAIAGAAGCSVGYLYKHFAGKREIMEAISLMHAEVYGSIRRHVRLFKGLEGLDALQNELQLLCSHLVTHRALIPVFVQYHPSETGAMCERKAANRREDVALLEAARLAGELPDVDPVDLAAVIDGSFWSLVKSLAGTADADDFLRIPAFIDELIFMPLRRQAALQRKDTIRS